MISNSDAQFFGPKNYLLSPGIETGRQGWSLFNTTLTSKIPTGAITAGAASITTFGSSSTTPLSGDYSLRVASSGAVTAGHGFISDAFTIDRQDRAKVMGWSFSFEAVSGTMDFSGTSANTWAVYIYDVDGAAWIQPTGVYNLVQSSGVGIASGTFQTTATGTQYRIAVICITATGGAVEMRLDAFTVGPQKVLQGPSGPVGEIIATGSVTPPGGFLYCNGQSVSVSQYQDLFNSIGYTYGGAGATFNVPDLRGVFLRGAGSQTIGAETYSATLGTKQNDATAKNGVSASTSGADGAHTHRVWTVGPTTDRLNWNSNAAAPNYPGWSLNTGGSANIGDFDIYASDVPEAPYQPNHGHAITVSSTDTETRPANVAVAYHIRYLATYQMSQDTDTRVISAQAACSTAFAYSAATPINFDSVITDRSGSVSPSPTAWKYTAPVSGDYRVSITLLNSVGAVSVNLFKNGSLFRQMMSVTTAAITSSSTTITLNAGDYIDMRGSGAATLASGSVINTFSVERLSGPATIAASEGVVAHYRRATVDGNQTLSSASSVVYFTGYYPSRVVDTHNMVTASASETYATIPVSGVYEIILMNRLDASALTETFQQFIMLGGTNQTGTLSVDGSSLTGGIVPTDTVGRTCTTVYSGRFNAGEIVRFKLLRYGTQTSVIIGTNFSGFTIKRVGN